MSKKSSTAVTEVTRWDTQWENACLKEKLKAADTSKQNAEYAMWDAQDELVEAKNTIDELRGQLLVTEKALAASDGRVAELKDWADKFQGRILRRFVRPEVVDYSDSSGSDTPSPPVRSSHSSPGDDSGDETDVRAPATLPPRPHVRRSSLRTPHPAQSKRRRRRH